jgi:hypothetical protein
VRYYVEQVTMWYQQWRGEMWDEAATILMCTMVALWTIIENNDGDQDVIEYHRAKHRKATRYKYQRWFEWINEGIDALADRFMVKAQARGRPTRKCFRKEASHGSIRGRPCNAGRRIWCSISSDRAFLFTVSTVIRGSSAMAYASTTEQGMSKRNVMFDTDAIEVRVDNCASMSMSFSREDFIPETLRATKLRVKGFGEEGSNACVTHQGTIVWDIQDDEGRNHKIVLPNSLLVPRAKDRLLSPQHWAQTAQDHCPKKGGTYCVTDGEKVVLWWKQARYKKTLLLNQAGSNVATIWARTGYKHAMAFAAMAGPEDLDNPICLQATE